MTRAFRSLRNFNYRLWAGGAIMSNVGTWMQRIAQDWLVLTQLTHHNATSVGVVSALQFAPQVLLLPLTGYAADRFDRRLLLMATQGAMGLLALGLGLLTVGGVVTLWQVYGFAFLLGCATAFDSPARQSFVSELVGESDLANAVALNSTSFNAARMIGPAIAGGLIAVVGSGWMFLINAASFLAVLGSLTFMRVGELHRGPRRPGGRGGLGDGFRYLRGRPELMVVLAMLFVVGTFGMNSAIYVSTMAVSVFHSDASQYGVLTSAMALGSVGAALLAARREMPRLRFVIVGVVIFALGCAAAALSPSFTVFGLALIIVGGATQTFTTSSIGLVQMSTEAGMRGRVMAIVMAITLGGTPIGAPIVGWVADRFGPRWGLAVGASAGLAAAGVAVGYLAAYRGLRVRLRRGRLRIELRPASQTAAP